MKHETSIEDCDSVARVMAPATSDLTVTAEWGAVCFMQTQTIDKQKLRGYISIGHPEFQRFTSWASTPPHPDALEVSGSKLS